VTPLVILCSTQAYSLVSRIKTPDSGSEEVQYSVSIKIGADFSVHTQELLPVWLSLKLWTFIGHGR
jgi:hypothetical protein